MTKERFNLGLLLVITIIILRTIFCNNLVRIVSSYSEVKWMMNWKTVLISSDWYKTRINKTNTNLFYRDGWRVSITDVETLKQWLEVNNPFPVTVMREKKYREITRYTFLRNPIIISTDDKYNLDEILPHIKEAFYTNNVDIIRESNNSFKVLIRKALLIGSSSEVDKTILNDWLKNKGPYSFKSIQEFYKAADIVNARYHGVPTPPDVEKANDLSYYPKVIVDKMMYGFWLADGSLDKWYADQKKAYAIFRNIAY